MVDLAIPDEYIVLVSVYVLLFGLGFTSFFGCFHVKTELFNRFCLFLMTACIARVLYFGVPWSDPSADPLATAEYKSPSFWLEFGQFALYCVGDWAVEAQYAQILRLWHRVRCVIEGAESSGLPSNVLPETIMNGSVYLFALWQLSLIVSMASGALFKDIVLVTSAGKCVVSILISSAFIYYLCTLQRAMKSIVQMEASSPRACGGVCRGCCSGGAGEEDEAEGAGDGASVALVNATKASTAFRARDKLRRVSRLCYVYCFCALCKVAFLLYQLSAATGKVSYDPYAWDYLLGFSYGLTEIVPAIFALFTMRKQNKIRSPTTGAAAFEAGTMT